jgi:hypothetical protein
MGGRHKHESPSWWATILDVLLAPAPDLSAPEDPPVEISPPPEPKLRDEQPARRPARIYIGARAPYLTPRKPADDEGRLAHGQP